MTECLQNVFLSNTFVSNNKFKSYVKQHHLHMKLNVSQLLQEIPMQENMHLFLIWVIELLAKRDSAFLDVKWMSSV